MGPLEPAPGEPPAFAQLYILDPDPQLERRQGVVGHGDDQHDHQHEYNDHEDDFIQLGQDETSAREVTARQFAVYRLQQRTDEPTHLFQSGRLFQEYMVDQYCKVENQRVNWIRFNQGTLRSDLYQGLADAMNHGDVDPNSIGRRVVLPSSFTVGPRYLNQRYQDAMAVVRKKGKPDLFITMTCNPNWDEITAELIGNQKASDRPDLTNRVFRLKLKELMDDLFKLGVLGKPVAWLKVVEFQKRGLPHAHILVILHHEDKLNSPDDYDKVICAEIPDESEDPILFNTVKTCMMHGPCGALNPNAPCMKDGECTKHYPKEFCQETRDAPDGYPVYRRRDNGRNVISQFNNTSAQLDNRWVVPYNPSLSRKFNCHINVEYYCASIRSVKYLYKYVYKGHDRAEVAFQATNGQPAVVPTVQPQHPPQQPNIDEIQQYQDGRYISASEAHRRLMVLPMCDQTPPVYRLALHMENQQQVRFNANEGFQHIVNGGPPKTTLTEWFELNRLDEGARQHLYHDIPSFYTWDKTNKKWKPRQRGVPPIGRMYSCSPTEGERYYLRLLLNHVPGALSYADLRTYI
eukprot:gene27773-17913_t